jgi:hypothetical protein
MLRPTKSSVAVHLAEQSGDWGLPRHRLNVRVACQAPMGPSLKVFLSGAGMPYSEQLSQTS